MLIHQKNGYTYFVVLLFHGRELVWNFGGEGGIKSLRIFSKPSAINGFGGQDGEGVVLWSIICTQIYSMERELRFRNNLKCLYHSTNVFICSMYPFLSPLQHRAIPSRFSGRASDGSVTVRSEESKREFFYAYKNKNKWENETKEWMDIFMVENVKRNQDQDWFWTNN